MLITSLYSSTDFTVQSDECPDICKTFNLCEISVARQFYNLFSCIN